MNPSAIPAINSRVGYSYKWLFVGLTALYCLWVLLLPLVPTQDGPVHLYLASIFRDFLGHSAHGGAHFYAQYYLVRHYLPPYSCQYYLLVALMHIISPLLAEKLFVCLIVISFAFGFRYLATGIGANGAVFSFFALCVLLNWSLSMGFENYLLSLTMAFWALGLWMRFRSRDMWAQRLGFIALLCLMALTHPVPVAIVLGFSGLDIVITFVFNRRPNRNASSTRHLLFDCVTLLAGSSVLLYISAFTEKHRTADNIRNTIHPLAELRSFYGHLEGVRLFEATDAPTILYHAALYLLLLIAAVVALGRYREASPGSLTWRVAFLFFLFVMPFMPMDINGSHMFAARLVILVWLAAFAAASGSSRLTLPLERACIALAVITSLGILWFAHREVNREARQIAELTTAIPAQQGQLGLLLPGVEHHIPPANDYGVDTYVWAGAHYFRLGQDVMLNTPWTDIPILPVNARPALGLADFDPATIEFYYTLREHIEDRNPAALRLLSQANFILFTTSGQPVDEAAVQRILLTDAPSQWSCASNTSWTEVCMRRASHAAMR